MFKLWCERGISLGLSLHELANVPLEHLAHEDGFVFTIVK